MFEDIITKFTPQPISFSSFLLFGDFSFTRNLTMRVISDYGNVLMPLDNYGFSERFGWLQDKYGLSWQLNLTVDVPEQRIVPFLMFVGDQHGRAEEAINYYI